MPLGQIIWSVIGIVLVIAAAYFTTYFIARRGTRGAMGGGMRLLDSFFLSKDKSVCAVEAAGRVYIFAMSSGAVTLLDTVDAEAYRAAAKKGGHAPAVSLETVKNSPVFSKFMDLARGRRPEVREPESSAPPERGEDGEDVL